MVHHLTFKEFEVIGEIAESAKEDDVCQEMEGAVRHNLGKRIV